MAMVGKDEPGRRAWHRPRTARGWLGEAGAAGGLVAGLIYFALVLRGHRGAAAPFLVLTMAGMLLARAVAFWPTAADTGAARRVWAALAGLALAAGLLGGGAGLAVLVGLAPTVADPVTLSVVGASAVVWLAVLVRPGRRA